MNCWSTHWIVSLGVCCFENQKKINLEHKRCFSFFLWKVSKVLVALNQVDIVNNQTEFVKLIQNKTLNLNINPSYMNSYCVAFESLRNEYKWCSQDIQIRQWFANKTIDDKYDFYFNLKDDDQYSWTMPNNYEESDRLITMKLLKVNNIMPHPSRHIAFAQLDRQFSNLKKRTPSIKPPSSMTNWSCSSTMRIL